MRKQPGPTVKTWASPCSRTKSIRTSIVGYGVKPVGRPSDTNKQTNKVATIVKVKTEQDSTVLFSI